MEKKKLQLKRLIRYTQFQKNKSICLTEPDTNNSEFGLSDVTFRGEDIQEENLEMIKKIKEKDNNYRVLISQLNEYKNEILNLRNKLCVLKEKNLKNDSSLLESENKYLKESLQLEKETNKLLKERNKNLLSHNKEMKNIYKNYQ